MTIGVVGPNPNPSLGFSGFSGKSGYSGYSGASGYSGYSASSTGFALLAGGNAFTGAQTLSVGATTSAATDLLINPATKASGNLLDLQVASASKFSLNYFGGLTIANNATITGGQVLLPNSRITDGAVAGALKLTDGNALALRVLTIGGTVPSTIGAVPNQGQCLSILQCMELLTIAASPTSTTTMLVPAGAIVLSVSVRVTTAIPTAASFTVKIGATTFNTAAVSVALDSTDMGTAAGAFYNATAGGVIITPDLTPGANTGRVRITCSYVLITPATS